MDFIRNTFTLQTEDSAKRVYHLDFVRGILILMVLYHHSMAPFSGYILQFHMPALFIMSGYTEFILNKEKTLLSYVKSKFFRLIVPYLCFEILNFILHVILRLISGKAIAAIGDAIFSIITCTNTPYAGLYGRLWFFPAIFVSSIFSYLIKKLFKNKSFAIGICCLLMLLLSYIFSTVIAYRLPFGVDIAFLGTAFSLMGYLFGNIMKHVYESKKIWFDLIILTISGVLFVLCNIIADPRCYMYINQYEDFPFMVVCAILGTAMTFIVAKYLSLLFERVSILKNVVLWFSVNSVAVFPVHLTLKVLSIPLLDAIGFNNWFLVLLIMLVFTIPIVNMIRTYVPFILGNRGLKK